MSHLYDTIEPNMVSEALLRQCVARQGPEGEAGRVSSEEGIDFLEVLELRLDFQNILHIENLWQFRSLCKLQLDNNIIEDISGLDTLTQLQWLDLSFNNIEVIRGLEKLVNLQDLSLAHNRIHRIEHLDCLTRLQVLSVGHNLIKDLENVKYLRPFRQLQSLCLKGNPLASSEHYQHHVVAFIPSLVYLDFQMILEEERLTAREAFQEALEELELHEREQARRLEEEREREQQEELCRSAYVDGLQGTALFDTLFEEDTDAERLKKLDGVQEMLESFCKGFVQYCEHLTKVGLEEKEKRELELKVFQTSHTEACTTNQQSSVKRVKEFEATKEKLLRSGGPQLEPGAHQEMEAAIGGLQHDLMKLEMELVEQLEEMSKDFERNYSDMVGGFLEQVQSHMTQLRDLENNHHEKVTEKALAVLELFVKNQLEEELPDELRMLFVDKDMLMGTINAAHDLHMLAIDNHEDRICSRAKKDQSAVLDSIQKAELTRNRRKVVEIEQYIEHQWEELRASEVQSR